VEDDEPGSFLDTNELLSRVERNIESASSELRHLREARQPSLSGTRSTETTHPPIETPITLDVGDVRTAQTEIRHLWAQELVRAGLAIAFFLLLGLTVIWALVLAGGTGWANAKEALQILLPAETGLLGSAAGFYFGSRRT
jgi:hypothetical protein